MSHPNSDPAPLSDHSGMSGFNAQSHMGLPEVLQMCCLSRRSGQITFRSGESYGFIYIQQGRVLHALCGTIEGEEAVYTMLTWPGGGFTLDEDILPHKKSVTLTWEQLLFEGARRADVGMLRPANSAPTITTAEPLTIRIQESQPRLTIMRPDHPPLVVQLEQEYTHVGRAANNEIALPYPSISNRHCIFIQSGPEVVVRDLNSSNGTYVNGEIVGEVVLRPGDLIEMGVVQMKFEPGVKRPKLTTSEARGPKEEMGALKKQAGSGALYYHTHKLPTQQTSRATPKAGSGKTKDNSAYVKGESAISYDDLAVPEPTKRGVGAVAIVVVLLVLALAGGAAYYFFVLHGGAAVPTTH